MSLNDIISNINKGLTAFVDAYPGGRIYGLTQPIARERRVFENTVVQVIPGVLSKDGEVEDVVLDNTLPFLFFHRLNGITVSDNIGKGYGDKRGTSLYQYRLSMCVYYGLDKVCMQPDELLIQVQHYFPRLPGKMGAYRIVQILLGECDTRSDRVFALYYQNIPYRLRPNDVLMSINYSVAAETNLDCVSSFCQP